MRRTLHALLSLALSAPLAAGQDDLQAAVELCFTVTDDTKAEERIAQVLTRPGLDPAELLRAVKTAPPRQSGERFTLSVPYRGQAFPVQVVPPVPPGDGPPAVVLDLFWNTVASHLRLEANALCWVDQYTPPEFSDEGRDAWRKILHSVSFALGGDPDRLWLTGFSWSGHAGYDVSMHRPGLVRGFVALGGGPRRQHWRLLRNLGATTRIVACCGAKDDPELVWNLNELDRQAASLKLDWHYTLDPDVGHRLPMKGMSDVAGLVASAPATKPSIPKAGTLLADSDHVALPWLEIVEVDPAAVAVPDRIPVAATLSADEKRRATIKAMSAKIAQIDWKFSPTKDGAGVVLELSAKGVKKAAIYVKEPWFDLGQKLQVAVKGKKLHDGPITIDPATLLREVRRTGDRKRPAVRRVDVEFRP